MVASRVSWDATNLYSNSGGPPSRSASSSVSLRTALLFHTPVNVLVLMVYKSVAGLPRVEPPDTHPGISATCHTRETCKERGPARRPLHYSKHHFRVIMITVSRGIRLGTQRSSNEGGRGPSPGPLVDLRSILSTWCLCDSIMLPRAPGRHSFSSCVLAHKKATILRFVWLSSCFVDSLLALTLHFH